jgi:hypothetical protein
MYEGVAADLMRYHVLARAVLKGEAAAPHVLALTPADAPPVIFT